MKPILRLGIAFAACLAMSTSASADVFFTESFDDDNAFFVSEGFFADAGGFDYFGLGGAPDDWGTGTTPAGLKAYTGFTDGFLTGMDLDGEGATLPITVDWTNIDISGRTGLEFSGDFAEFFDAPGDIDELDILRVEAQIDGGGYVTVLEFVPANFTSGSGPFNGFFTNGGLTLGNAAQNFTGAIAGTGTALDLRLTVSVNSGDEDFAVDNFILNDNAAVPEPGSLAVLGLMGLVFVGRRRR